MTSITNNALQRTDYLNKVVSLPLPATLSEQDIVISVGPDQGQYWIPKIVRIALSSDTLLETLGTFQRTAPSAQLYYGGPQTSQVRSFSGQYDTVDNAGLLLDTTHNGFRDQTGVVSGMIVSPGEHLTVVWRDVSAAYNSKGVAVASSAFVQILGSVTTLPPSVINQFLPEQMGPPFVSSPNAGQLTVPTQVQPFWFANPGPGGTVQFNLVNDAVTTRGISFRGMAWAWNGTTTDHGSYGGDWQIYNSTGGTTTFMYDNMNGGSNSMSFEGLAICQPGAGNVGLQFAQASADAAGTIYCAGTLTYSGFYGS